jgi:hypothetical protein
MRETISAFTKAPDVPAVSAGSEEVNKCHLEMAAFTKASFNTNSCMLLVSGTNNPEEIEMNTSALCGTTLTRI